MSDKPTALRLAAAVQQQAVWEGHYGPSYLRDLLPEAAAELRRLYDLHGKANALCRIRAARIKELEALNAELVEALRLVTIDCGNLHHAARHRHGMGEPCPVEEKIRAVLTKVEASNEQNDHS